MISRHALESVLSTIISESSTAYLNMERYRQGYVKALTELFPLLPQKFPEADINRYHMIKSLSYFDDAEREPWPIMHKQAKWIDVKDYFLEQQKSLLEENL